ncbi:MAG: type II toxin-antitoxin system RelE/ParE family toxin [Rhodomicrobium sp.]|nr:type II toxin-antitoxin system RelE/ParE family toxin [Rhodomicrobium sp.]
MLDVKRIKSNKLKRLVKHGDGSKIDPKWLRKVQRVLHMLNAAVHPAELDLPGFGLHEMKGNRAGTFSVTISGNWRLTFRWDESGPYDLDLEDYHGK